LLASTVLSLNISAPKDGLIKIMIRFFTALCKKLLQNYSEETEERIVKDATGEFHYYSESCPHCGAVGRLSPYGSYSRWLISHENGQLVAHHINLLRFICSSCNTTHALLPDIIIPYSSYSLRFKLKLLLSYFERTTTVEAVCLQFGIAVSTLYEWKKLLYLHKELFFGLLISQQTPALAFLCTLLHCSTISTFLCGFFHKYAFSFLQGTTPLATRSNPP